MTLTYRGQKYVQNKAAITGNRSSVLDYRGNKVAR